MGTLRDLQFALQLKIEELRQRDTLIDELELELDTKDELIRRLQEELDRFRATASQPGPSAAGSASSSAPEERPRRKAVVSEPFTLDAVTLAMVSQRSCDKSQESQRLIQAAFLKNDLLKNLGEAEMRAVAACMCPSPIQQGCYVIQEGSSGAQAYVLEEGRLDVTRDGLKLLTVEPEEMFGELALLYSCTHTFSVSAQTDSKLWVIDRRSYQTILMQRGLCSLSRSTELLSSVPFLQSLPEDVIMKLSDLTEETRYADGDYIIRQGATGDTCYVISSGRVKVTEKKDDEEPELLCELREKQWFGEKALWGEDVRAVSAVAAGEVACLVVDRETFRDVAGEPTPGCTQEEQQQQSEWDQEPDLLPAWALADLRVVRSLAVGEFGHVDLVQLRSDSRCVFALKVLRKKPILSSGQRENVQREGRVLTETRCPFIARIHKAFRDAESLYVVTDAGLCGDLSRLLRHTGRLDEGRSRFFTSCVVEALAFLHRRGVVYRDLKPENVVLDERGFAKLIGSRCLKKVEAGQKTWTFCGTPGFMAPEVVLHKGHSASADFWSLGVFVFELLSDRLPFSGSDPMTILTETIRGIDHVDFPKCISRSASSLIKKLCRRNPSERLGSLRNGATDVQKHKWFEGFDWDGLCRRTLTPPPPPPPPQAEHPEDSSLCDLYSDTSAELLTDWEDF